MKKIHAYDDWVAYHVLNKHQFESLSKHQKTILIELGKRKYHFFNDKKAIDKIKKDFDSSDYNVYNMQKMRRRLAF